MLICRLVDEKSGRAITLESTQNGLQFYTGNFLNNIKGRNGNVYNKHGALCLETQNFSDSVNNQVEFILVFSFEILILSLAAISKYDSSSW